MIQKKICNIIEQDVKSIRYESRKQFENDSDKHESKRSVTNENKWLNNQNNKNPQNQENLK